MKPSEEVARELFNSWNLREVHPNKVKDIANLVDQARKEGEGIGLALKGYVLEEYFKRGAEAQREADARVCEEVCDNNGIAETCLACKCVNAIRNSKLVTE